MGYLFYTTTMYVYASFLNNKQLNIQYTFSVTVSVQYSVSSTSCHFLQLFEAFQSQHSAAGCRRWPWVSSLRDGQCEASTTPQTSRVRRARYAPHSCLPTDSPSHCHRHWQVSPSLTHNSTADKYRTSNDGSHHHSNVITTKPKVI